METRPLALPLEIPLEGPHHLDSLAAEIHRTYFFKMPPLRVRWGHSIARKRRRSIRLGSYNHVTLEIRIHPALNSPRIPSPIHHKSLHPILGATHNRRFHAHERLFRYHRESKEWLRRNLFGLLGLRRKREISETRALSQMALF